MDFFFIILKLYYTKCQLIRKKYIIQDKSMYTTYVFPTKYFENVTWSHNFKKLTQKSKYRNLNTGFKFKIQELTCLRNWRSDGNRICGKLKERGIKIQDLITRYVPCCNSIPPQALLFQRIYGEAAPLLAWSNAGSVEIVPPTPHTGHIIYTSLHKSFVLFHARMKVHKM